MPYTNLPKNQWAKMDRCVEAVQAEGYDEKAAIAICYTSIAKSEKAGGMTVLPTGTTDVYTGAIAALWVDRELGNNIALPADDSPSLTPLAPTDLHITLLYFGDTTDPAATLRKNEIIIAMAAAATKLPVVTASIGGLGQFFPVEGNPESALYASVDSPDLELWRNALLECLSGFGVSAASNAHVFNPHMTLAYTQAPVDLADVQVEPIDLEFTHLTLAWGGELIHFPLTDIRLTTTKAEADDSGKPKRSSFNWGARAGQTIRGNLARGNDGKFTSAGNASAKPTPKPTQAQPTRQPVKLPTRQAPKRATGEGSRGGKTQAQRDAESKKRQAARAAETAKRQAAREAERKKKTAARDAERAKKKIEREAEAAKKKAERDAKRAAAGGGKGGGGRGESEADKKTEAAKRKKIFVAIDKFGENTPLTSAERDLLIDEGLIEDKDGKLTLTDAGKIVMAQEAADDKKKGYTPAFAVFKDAGGKYRWVAVSSNAYRDRDGEIVSTKALEDDITRTDADGMYGPLRWWHVGNPTPFDAEKPWGDGLDIGSCDFAALHGRMLIESGTFESEEIARKAADFANDLQVSLGFLHPINEPDSDGVFNTIRRFERSLVPAGFAANPFTRFSVEERGYKGDSTMLQQKVSAFLKMFGGDENRAAAILDQVAQAEKAATDAGVAYKAGGPDDVEEDVVEVEDDGETDMTELTESEDEMEMPEDSYIGNMTMPEFSDMLNALLDAKLAPFIDALSLESKMGEHIGGIKAALDEVKARQEMFSKKEAAATKDTSAQIQSMAATITALKTQLAAVEATAKELAGEQPAIVGGYQASKSSDNLMGADHPLRGAAPQESMLDFFVRGLQQPR